MEINRAGMDDYAEIRAFYDDVILHTPGMKEHVQWKIGMHPTDDTIKQYIQKDSMYLCQNEGEIIGAMAVTMDQGEDYRPIPWVLSLCDDEVAVLHMLAVKPDGQKKGLGREMIRWAIGLAKDSGKKAFRLDALETNLVAQKIYSSMGFERRGSQFLYTENTGLAEFFYYEYEL